MSKEVLVIVEGDELKYIFEDTPTPEEIDHAMEGIGGRPKDRDKG